MTGGGDSNSGSADARDNVQMPPGWQNLPPADQERLKSIGRAINEAQNQIRQDKVEPALLAKLGMTQDEFGAFVEKYAQHFEKGPRKAARETTLPGRTVPNAFELSGKDGLQKGKSVEGGIEAQGAEKLDKDQLRKLYESRAAEVSPEYRKGVEDYYRSISEGQTDRPAAASQPK